MGMTKQVPITQPHAKSPTANLEELRRLSGSIPFKGTLPSKEFLDADDPPQPAERAGD